MDAMEVDSTINQDIDLDEGLYSRQLYVFGHEAQRKMGNTNVLIVGMQGLGAEIAKNVILAGVKSVGLLDNALVGHRDLGSNFYLTEDDIGKPRAVCCAPRLAELNNYVDVKVIRDDLTDELLEKGIYQVVVCLGKTTEELVEINRVCHAQGIAFISGDIMGLFVSVFVDLGSHVITDEDGEPELRGLISHISRDNPGIVTVHEDHRHNLQDGMFVTFEEVQGMTELNDCPPQQVKVLTPYTFSIQDTSGFQEYTGTKGYFNQVKKAIEEKFAPLEDRLVAPIFVSDQGSSFSLHALYLAVSAFRKAHNGEFPTPNCLEDAIEVLELAKELAKDVSPKGSISPPELDEKLVLKLARVSGAHLNPMAAFAGGVIGQEVLKACSSKFTPIVQNFYFDASSALPDELHENLNVYKPLGTRYDDQISVFGLPVHEKITSQSLFLVGAGAIGCEMLKNWALMGVATDEKACVHVTDMDNIEKSNLNRQFLFRRSDVQQLKSVTAAREAKKMNPDMNLSAKALRVGTETESVYDDFFWGEIDACVTALDNVEARLYCDSRCIYFKKPLLDSGTLGTKGNTQVVVPFLTEAYGSSRDPPEESIPICTIKNFPNKIEHTIQWAREWFEGTFKKSADDVNQYLQNADFLTEIASTPNTQIDILESIRDSLIISRPLGFDQCIQWARLQFEKEFHHKIRQLITTFPPDAKTNEGTDFWSGHKRAPTPLIFDASDKLHIKFIEAAAHLRAFVYGLQPSDDPEYLQKVLQDTEIPEFHPRVVKIATTDEEAKEMANAVLNDHDIKVNQICTELPNPSTLAGYRLHPVDFEKDDPSNFHVAFISACSNLRARNYEIKEVSEHETKQIAGKIIPAIATTTALVTGLVSLEMYKIVQEMPIEAFRNTFVNLAICLFAGSEPFPCEKHSTELKGSPWEWSLWDQMEVDIEGRDITLQEFIDHFETQYGLEVSMLSFGPSMIYYNWSPKKMKKRLTMKMSRLIEKISKKPISEGEKFLVLEACVCNADGDDVEIPSVRYRFR